MWVLSRYVHSVMLFFLCGMAYMPVSFAQQPLGTESGELNRILLNAQTLQAAGPDTLLIRRQLARIPDMIRTQPDSTLYLITDCLQKSLRARYYYGIVQAYSHLANFYELQGDYDRSLSCYFKAIPYAMKGFKNPDKLALLYSSISGTYFYKSMYDSMSFFSYKAEQLLHSAPIADQIDARSAGSVYANIGTLWLVIGDYEKARSYLFKALDKLSAFKDSASAKQYISDMYNNIGFAYRQSGDTEQAAQYYTQALVIDESNTLTLNGLGILRMEENRMEEAMELLQRANAISQNGGHLHRILTSKAALGLLYYKLGQHHEAKNILEQAIDLAGKKMDKNLHEKFYDVYKTLSLIYRDERQYKRAYDYSEKARMVLSEQMAKEKVYETYRQEMKTQAALKDKQIAQEKLLLSEHKSRLREQNIWMAAIGCSSVLLLIALGALYRSSRHKQRLHMERINSISKEQEIDHFKAMIKGEEKERSRLAGELHDGIMVQLSTVKMGLKSVPESYYRLSCGDYVQTPYYRSIVQQMEEVTVELRRTAHNLMPDMLLEGGIADAVFYFCNTLKHNGLHVSYQQHGTIPRLPGDFELSVFRIIQELLQNVVKHAEATHVMVQLAEIAGHILSVTVEDNGKGFDPDMLPEGKGMGLKSVASRIQVLKGVMDIRSRPGEGTLIHLEFEMPVNATFAGKEQEKITEL